MESNQNESGQKKNSPYSSASQCNKRHPWIKRKETGKGKQRKSVTVKRRWGSLRKRKITLFSQYLKQNSRKIWNCSETSQLFKTALKLVFRRFEKISEKMKIFISSPIFGQFLWLSKNHYFPKIFWKIFPSMCTCIRLAPLQFVGQPSSGFLVGILKVNKRK